MRILLADKDPYDLDAMRSELGAPGVQIDVATDGRDVLAACARQRPDVVVMNASLRSMGAFAVSRDLKMFADIPRAAAAPRVVILLERAADSWLATWSRCDAWRVKPVSPEDLWDLIGWEPSR